MLEDGTSGSAKGQELWKTDGTSAGTVLVKDIRSGNFGSNPSNFENVGGTLFFRANDGSSGNELFKSDGTTGGTTLLHNIIGGSDSSFPQNLTNVGGTLFFSASATNSDNRDNVFSTDGTTLTPIADINGNNTYSGSIGNFTNIGGTLFFTADDGSSNDQELWKTNGSTVTHLPGSGNSGSNPTDLTAVGGNCLLQGHRWEFGLRVVQERRHGTKYRTGERHSNREQQFEHPTIDERRRDALFSSE